MTGQVDHIVWSCHNRLFAPEAATKIPGIKIVEGLPTIETVPPNTLLVIDDLQMSNLKDVCTLFCVSSHHKNISVFFLIQNLFFSNPYMRTVSLNATHFILWKNSRDINQINYLARQIFPDHKSSFLKVFKEITKQPYSYLIIDISQCCCPCLRIKTDIFNKNYFVTYASDSDYDNQKFIEKSTINGVPYACIENYLM